MLPTNLQRMCAVTLQYLSASTNVWTCAYQLQNKGRPHAVVTNESTKFASYVRNRNGFSVRNLGGRPDESPHEEVKGARGRWSYKDAPGRIGTHGVFAEKSTVYLTGGI